MPNKITTEEFIKRSKEIHGEKYLYERSDYKGSGTKIIITCRDHGDFEQVAVSHTKGSGCSECKGVKKLTTESFIKKANTVHQGRYRYSKTDFKNIRTKVVITCKEHGDFEQTPNRHLNGAGCSICGGVAIMSNEDCIDKFKKVHGELYHYDKVNYKGSQVKVIIGCKIHGYFEQAAANHYNGQGCRKCGNLLKGWNRSNFIKRCGKNNNGLGTFYVIRCFNSSESFYKIGITSNSVKRRYDGGFKMPYKYEVIHEILTDPLEAYNLENKIIRELKEYKYQPNIFFEGQTECLSTLEPIQQYLI